MIRGLTLSLLIFASGGCETTDRPIRGPDGSQIDYRYEDNPEQNKILLFFRNTTKRPICLGAENWPQNGVMLNTGDEVWLEIDQRRHYLAPEQDYCPQCVKKVMPGEEHQGFFRYQSFGLADSDSRKEKKLSFIPMGFSCR